MKKVAKRIRGIIWLTIKAVFIAFVAGLACVGVLTIGGWSAKEALTEFTPLFLGTLSILIAFTTLSISISEGRRQAKRQRDEAVRPILFIEGGDGQIRFKNQILVEACQPCPDKMIMDIRRNYLTIENCGLGLALKIMFFVRSGGKLLSATNVIQKLAVGEKITVELHHFLESNRIDELLTSYFDLFGNVHYCKHLISMDDREMIHGAYSSYLNPDEATALWSEIKESTNKDASRARAMEERAKLEQRPTEAPQ